MDDRIVHQLAQAELGQQPDGQTGGEDAVPAPADGGGEDKRAAGKKDHVHGQDVEQGRAVDQEHRAGNGDKRMGDVEVEQVINGCAMRGDGETGGHREREREHQQVIAVDLQRAAPELGAQAGFVLHRLVDVEAGDEQRREKDKAFRRGDEAKRLIHQVAEMGRQMGQRHPNEEKASQCIQLRLSWQLGEFHRLLE